MDTIIGFDVYTYSERKALRINAEVYSDNLEFLVFRNRADLAEVSVPRAEIRKAQIVAVIAIYETEEVEHEGGNDEQKE